MSGFCLFMSECYHSYFRRTADAEWCRATDAGIHMGSHVMAIGLSWAAYILVRHLEKRVDNPYDTDKVLSLSAFASGVILLVFALFIIVEAIERLTLTDVEISTTEAVTVAVMGLVVNGICALVLNDHHHHDSDINSHSAFLHVMADALTSIGAIFGLICAMIWGITWVDTAVAFILSLVIIRWAKGLLWTTAKSLTRKDKSDLSYPFG